MTQRNARWTLILIWAAWAAIIIGFQTLVDTRIQPDRPDYVLEWTQGETNRNSQKDKPYLIEPFMNNQVSMDSEYYLSIAVAGYDDPVGRSIEMRGETYTLNYAFFPLYPNLMKVVMLPLSVFGLNPIATATLAGVIIALLGTLGGMFALYDLTRAELEDAGAVRTAFYLIIFPAGFFLAQVYTEGLFVGLAFGALAFARRKNLLLAGVLAFLATLTRSLGLALVAPLVVAWLSQIDWQAVRAREFPRLRVYAIGFIGVVLPLLAYFIWQSIYGANFRVVEEEWFGRELFNIKHALEGWGYAFEQIFEPEVPARRIYYLLELGAVLLAIVASLFTIRRYPGVALFGLVALVVALTSGYPQSLIRYVLTIPAIFIFLGRLGRAMAFDRAWTVASVLLLSLLTSLFTWDMWVA
jgi:Gpi18-like mannosyltransferase